MIPAAGSMSALVQDRPGLDGLAVDARPIPEPGPGEVLIKVHACGLGGTVLHKVRRASAAGLPTVPGHEAAGEIVAAGPGVTTLSAGDRVLLYYYLTCGRCEHCLAGDVSTCMGQVQKIGEHEDGALAEYVRAPARNCLPLSPALSYRDATVLPDAVATPVHVCRRARVGPGDRMVVIGAAGGVGVHLVQVARAFGAEVVGVDLGAKSAALEELGITAVAVDDAGWSDLARWATVVVDLVGTAETFGAAVSSCERGGRVVVLVPHFERQVCFAPSQLINDELTIMGSKYADPHDVTLGGRLLAAGSIRAVIGSTVGLDGVRTALQDIDEGRVFGRTVVSLVGDAA